MTLEKLMFFERRPDGVERAAFCERYLREHVPLVLRHTVALRRYVIALLDKGPDDFDLVIEVWLDSIDDYADRSRLYDSPEGATAVEASRCALVGSTTGYRVDERVERDYERTWPNGEPSPGVKMIAPMRRRDGLTHDQFVAHWRDTHVPLALDLVPGMWRYATNAVIEPITPDAPEIDGIVVVHRQHERDLKLRPTPEDQARVDADVEQFLIRPQRNQAREYILRS